MADKTSVLLADDHPLYRAGLAGLIAVSEDLEVVGQASDGIEAVALAARLRPDVAVLDLNMPGLHGIEATRQIIAACPGMIVIVLTMLDDDASIFRAVQAGARGYVLKTDAPSAVLGAIRTGSLGETVFSAALAERLAAWFAGLGASRTPLPQLTPRERDVLALMARGCDNAAIGSMLGVSQKTVRNIASNLLTKLQVTDRKAAVAKARSAGLL